MGIGVIGWGDREAGIVPGQVSLEESMGGRHVAAPCQSQSFDPAILQGVLVARWGGFLTAIL